MKNSQALRSFDYKLGDTFFVGRKMVRVSRPEFNGKCTGCILEEFCDGRYNEGRVRLFGNCSSDCRKDDLDVIFKEVGK